MGEYGGSRDGSEKVRTGRCKVEMGPLGLQRDLGQVPVSLGRARVLLYGERQHPVFR